MQKRKLNEDMQIPFLGDNSLVQGISSIIGSALSPLGRILEDFLDIFSLSIMKSIAKRGTNKDIDKIINRLKENRTAVNQSFERVKSGVSDVFASSPEIGTLIIQQLSERVSS